ncbi:MAG: hypothetical protein A2008_04790 [Candidatus Wallbacteria bacterium GWC2_49_35]|uniref:Ig-like domain-containing protein n=1 Tax=Candidatus Wallbacteria bacterium GWC2_49_35 TaxID=1817813 RepID=A0A1F7X135_9BACT|nr:MAG: hypothetical protein A2008_04790 [Candidatus Wallbacteria bacterium GWC2_49_35]
MTFLFSALLLAFFVYGCGGSGGESPGLLSSVTGIEQPQITGFDANYIKSPAASFKTSVEEEIYFEQLEIFLNKKSASSATSSNFVPAAVPVAPGLVLSSISLDKNKDSIDILPPAPALYDLSKITVTAEMSDKTTKTVQTVWYLYAGEGSIIQNIYTPPNKNTTVTLVAQYSEGAVVKNAVLRLSVTTYNSLKSIELSSKKDSMKADADNTTYDLSSILATANYGSNSSRDITADPLLKWTKISGPGSLAGKIYSAPAQEGEAVFEAAYTEGGVSKFAQFNLKLITIKSISVVRVKKEKPSKRMLTPSQVLYASITSIETDPNSARIVIASPGPSTFDCSTVTVIANYNDGSTVDVTLASKTTWTLISGLGSFNATTKIYTATSTPETAALEARYKPGGTTFATTFSIYVVALNSITLSSSSTSINGTQTFDLATLTVTANYSDTSTLNVTGSTTWSKLSGAGTLAGTVYTAPTNTETATFQASYTEAGNVKTAIFTVNVTGLVLDTITLAPTSDDTYTSSVYDLGGVAVTANFVGGYNKAVTGSAAWIKLSGAGTLVGNSYTAPDFAEIATFQASYSESGVTKTTTFTLNIAYLVVLTSISLSSTSANIDTNQAYDLSVVTVTAYYNDLSSQNVTSSATWSKISGAGTLIGKVYTAVSAAETAVIRASYTDGGITKTADFSINVKALSSISLNPTSGTISTNSTYNLPAMVAVTATYSDSTTGDVTGSTTWSKISGLGTLVSGIYTSTASAETASLQASFTAAGVTKTATFTLTVTSTGIYLVPNTGRIIIASPAAVYDYSTVKVIYFSGATTTDVTLNSKTTWSKISGLGTLNTTAKTYTTTSSTETATLRAQYKPGGTAYTADFALSVVSLNSITLAPTSANINGNQTYDLSVVTVTANYSDAAMQNVTGSTTWTKLSGAGTLAGTVYTAPTNTETATFQAGYTRSGITKTATFTLNVTGLVLSSITLAPTSADQNVNLTYDLNSVAVTANFVGGHTKLVTGLATWSKLSGAGTLAGTVYTTPAFAETATFQASYTESGVAKTATFTLNVIFTVVLTSISLSSTSADINTYEAYDLATITVTAYYNDLSSQNVTSSATWSKISGAGTLAGKVYTAAAVSETAVIRASYTDGGVTKTADFSINVKALSSIALTPASDEMPTNGTYDLSAMVTVTATYSDSTTGDATGSTTWSKISGLGTLAGGVYTSTASAETATLRASFTAAGITKTSDFTINVSSTGIYLVPNNVRVVTASPAAVYACSAVTVVYFNGGTTTDVTLNAKTTWSLISGFGSFDTGTKDYTTTSAPETATLRAQYKPGGTAYTADFTLNVVLLDSITLTPDSANIDGGQTCDLSTATVTANYSDAATLDVTGSTTWTKLSGNGSLAGTVYTAPTTTETATFQASYTQSGITRTATFTINVTGVALDHIALAPVSANINGIDTYDLTTPAVTAYFVGGYNKLVTSSATWSKLTGAGSLVGTVYTAPSYTETATFEAGYTESGVTKTATFTINVTGLVLDTISLAPVSANINGTDAYDLATPAVTANFVGGYNKLVTSSATWSKLTGAGSLVGTVYTAPSYTETATFEAGYTESGVTKTVTFTINVTGLVLDTISLAPVSANINGTDAYDLATPAVTANFVGGYNKLVTSFATWSKLTGAGSLVGTVYTAPSYAETATFEAGYTESGVTKTAVFTINVTVGGVTLTSITLSQASATSEHSYYMNIDLAALTTVTATYTDSSTVNVTINPSTVWTKLSGPGTLSGSVYTSTMPGTATFEVAYTDLGVTKTTGFTLNCPDTTAPTVVLSDSITTNDSYTNGKYFVRVGWGLVIYADFTENDTLDESTAVKPKISIKTSTGTAVVNGVAMTKSTSTRWTYTWNPVPNAPYRWYYVTIAAQDRAGNLCEAPTGMNKYVIYYSTTYSSMYPSPWINPGPPAQ